MTTTSLTHLATDHIRRRMLTGQLRPGSRLSNSALAKEIGISRTPVREAISRLASGGLVEQVDGIGAFVKMPEADEIEDLLELRRMLETYAVERAAARITGDQLDQLKTNCDQMRGLVECMTESDTITSEIHERKVMLDMAFHSTLVEAAANHWITRVFNDLQVMTRVFAYKRVHGDPDHSAGNLRRTVQEHDTIIEALRRRDSEEARRLLDMHLQNYPYVVHPDVAHASDNVGELTPEQMAFLRRRGQSFDD